MRRDDPTVKIQQARLRAEVEDLARDYAQLFRENPIGVRVLNDLNHKFFEGSLLDSEPTKMAHKVGMRDLVAYINDMANNGETLRVEVQADAA